MGANGKDTSSSGDDELDVIIHEAEAFNKKDNAIQLRSNALTVAYVFGGAAALFTVVSSPFLVIPAFRRLGGIPWMVSVARSLYTCSRRVSTHS
jgi:hypothetical protein